MLLYFKINFSLWVKYKNNDKGLTLTAHHGKTTIDTRKYNFLVLTFFRFLLSRICIPKRWLRVNYNEVNIIKINIVIYLAIFVFFFLPSALCFHFSKSLFLMKHKNLSTLINCTVGLILNYKLLITKNYYDNNNSALK